MKGRKKTNAGKNEHGVYFRQAGLPVVWDVGIYIRLSVADGGEVSLSVQNQEAIIRYFLENEFGEPYRIHKTYVDDGVSGTTDSERTSFREMIRDIEGGRVNCVVSKTLSRVFRNYSDQGYFLEEYFPRMGIRFITLEAPKVDTFADPNAVRGYELPLNGIVNDRLAETTSLAVRQTFKNMRRKGEFQGGFPPYGYIRDPDDKHRFIVDEEAAAVVRQIFHWYVDDRRSMEAIRRRLNALRVPNPTGYKAMRGMKYHNPGVTEESRYAWTGKSVKRVLQNRVYIGDMVQGRCMVISYKVHRQIQVPESQWEIVPDRHEPIVEKELFDRAQELLSLNRTMKYYGRNPSLFAGFLYCADCGARMHKRKSGRREYYACSTYYKRSKEDCTPHFIRAELIENAVLEAIRRQVAEINTEELLSGIPEERRNARRARTAGLIESKEREIRRLDRRIENLYLDFNKRIIEEERYLRLKADFEEAKGELERTARLLRQEMDDEENGGSEADRLSEEFRENRNIARLDRRMLEEMVERIYVEREKNITILFNYRDPFR